MPESRHWYGVISQLIWQQRPLSKNTPVCSKEFKWWGSGGIMVGLCCRLSHGFLNEMEGRKDSCFLRLWLLRSNIISNGVLVLANGDRNQFYESCWNPFSKSKKPAIFIWHLVPLKGTQQPTETD
jgi:hypothetical protein